MIAVTGLMRSGTSPLAMILHQMGVTMGAYMRFPLHNEKSHPEWEDADLAESLVMLIVKQHGSDAARRVIDRYVRRRIRVAKGKPWGVKTPFLLPFISDLRSVCEEMGEPFRLAVTHREYSQTITSLRRQVEHLSIYERGGVFPNLIKIQNVLAPYWSNAAEGADVYEFKDTRERPRDVARRLADLAGVDIDVDVAIRGIRGGEL